MPETQFDTSTLEGALLDLGQKRYTELSRGRFAEEREWYQSALFDQLKQWLEWDGTGKRWKMIEISKDKPVPMPVSNYFSKTIAANANSLGAKIPEMQVQSNDQNPVNRRAAEAAERSLDEIDEESGMKQLNPILAKHTVLWGVGCAWDMVDTSGAGQQIPSIETQPSKSLVCPQCGYSEPEQEQQPEDALGSECPECGALMQEDESAELGDVQPQQFATGKIKTEIVPVFEIFLPRDCSDPNLAGEILRRFRKPLEKAKSLYPGKTDELKGDQSPKTDLNLSQFYEEALRYLVYTPGTNQELVTFQEHWMDWNLLPKDVQDKCQTEWGQQPSAAYQGMSKCDAAMQHGIYWISAGGKMMDSGENPWEGHKPPTFFGWQKDAANPYPKGLSVELIPLQKQLNRLDSLIELSCMANGAGKWISPRTQVGTAAFTGTPTDVIWYDNLGDGKVKPEFILPTPISQAVMVRRQQILNDFKELGYTSGVSEGDSATGGATAFRAIAFLGAKAEEARQTQRYLWESAHELRKKKVLLMAQKCWDEPRKVKVAGFNNAFGMEEYSGADLTGEYTLSVVKDSSKPKTLEEKGQTLQILLMGGLLDPTDSQTRDYICSVYGVTEVDLADHLQYVKAGRDLNALKNGEHPMESPFQKWDIYLKVFSQYTLTEEFEQLDPQIQQGILLYTQYISDKLTLAGGGMLGGMGAQMAGAMNGGQPPANPLSGVPGQTTSPQSAEGAAVKEGTGITNQIAPATAG
jgi:hypothetical protein